LAIVIPKPSGYGVISEVIQSGGVYAATSQQAKETLNNDFGSNKKEKPDWNAGLEKRQKRSISGD